MRLRTYLVEDSPVIRDNLAETLEELASARIVGWAGTESEASAWLTGPSSSWDLAVVDLYLLHGTGVNVIKACASRHPHQKLVVLTSYATPTIRQHCLALGADAVFDKSTQVDELMRYAREEVARANGATVW